MMEVTQVSRTAEYIKVDKCWPLSLWRNLYICRYSEPRWFLHQDWLSSHRRPWRVSWHSSVNILIEILVKLTTNWMKISPLNCVCYFNDLSENKISQGRDYYLNNVSRVEPLDTQVGQLLLQFPEGKSLYDVDWIGVLSRRKKVCRSQRAL